MGYGDRPTQNPQTNADSSDNRAKETDAFGGQISLKITFNEQTPEEVKRGILSQALLASILSCRSAIGSIDSGSDMNYNIANVKDDTFIQAVTVMNTVADVRSVGNDFSN